MSEKLRFVVLCVCILVSIFLVFYYHHSVAYGANYDPVICDLEPDPVKCLEIQNWYQQALQPASTGSVTSCCGLGDAYWVDQIDEINADGVFATITDDRNINGRISRNNQRVFIPKEKLDDRFQGNPTGHNVVFLGSGVAYYDHKGYPQVYCAFLQFGN